MNLPKRKSARLQGYEYSQNGAYFITICTKNKSKLLSDICRGGALLRPLGTIVALEIESLSSRFNISIDKYVIMPNHIHLIATVTRAEQSPAPTISDIVCALKSVTTKIANEQDNTIGRQIWQRSFHDHVIRNKPSYEKIWQYIDTNPLKWQDDCFYCE
ncbi:MAG: transposase [Oscillospiraceae bacterium]